jgi:hypothetical protein
MFAIYGGIDRLDWRKAKRSMNGGNCVQIASKTGIVVVRDSKNPDGITIPYSAGGWRSFVGATKMGNFDTTV